MAKNVIRGSGRGGQLPAGLRITRLIPLIIFFIFLNKPYSLAAPSDKPMVMPLEVNGKFIKEIEIRLCEDGDFALPAKAVAEILEINYSYNKLEKRLSIENNTIDAPGQKIIINSENITLTKPVLYSKNLIITDIPDDIFVPAEILEKFLKTSIHVDCENLNIEIQTEKNLALSKEKNNTDDIYNSQKEKEIIKTILPDNKRNFSFQTLNIQGNSNLYNSRQAYINSISEVSSFNNTFNTSLKGNLFKGNVEINNAFAMADSGFNYGGMGFKYNKELKKYKIEVGNLDETKIGDFSAGRNILGIRIDKAGMPVKSRNIIEISDINTQKPAPAIQGIINKNSRKILKMNGDRADYTIFSGIAGYDYGLFSSYEGFDSTKKLVTGTCFKKTLTEKFDISFSGIHDVIISSLKSEYLPDFVDSRIRTSLLNFNSYKNFNNIQGKSLLLSGHYRYSNNLEFEPSFGTSFAKNKSLNKLNPDGQGFCTSLKTSFTHKNFKLKNKIYFFSPDFYFAGNSGWSGTSNSTNDKAGLTTNISYANKVFSINAYSQNYLSDLKNRVGFGKISVNDLGLSGHVKLWGNDFLYYNLREKLAINDLGELRNANYSFNYSKNITNNLRARVDLRYFKNTLRKSDDDFESSFKNNIFRLGYNLPKNLGQIGLEHESFVNSGGSRDITNKTINISYNMPVFWRLSPSFKIGIPYSSDDKGINCDLSLGYKFKSGREVRVNYSYNRSLGYIYDNFYVPSGSRHMLSINLLDCLSLLGGIKSSNPYIDDKGYIKICTFLDKNENGIKEPEEIPVPDVQVRIQNINRNIKTDKKGEYVSNGIKEDNYRIFLEKNTLPVHLSPLLSNENYEARVKKDRVTRVYIPLLNSPGVISGKVKIKDELGNEVKIKDFIVCIYDEAGKEINYTYTDDEMNFSFSNLKPGNYSIRADKDYELEYCLKSCPGELNIEIPSILEGVFQVNNLVVNYIQRDYI